MQVTESAAAATALLSGTKATSSTVGLLPKSREKNCSGLEENKISSILDWAMDAGSRNMFLNYDIFVNVPGVFKS